MKGKQRKGKEMKGNRRKGRKGKEGKGREGKGRREEGKKERSSNAVVLHVEVLGFTRLQVKYVARLCSHVRVLHVFDDVFSQVRCLV